MKTAELFITALALSMDAFAVSVCKGMAARRANIKSMLTAGLYFGISQALMPLIGFWAGGKLTHLLQSFSHPVAAAILMLIGINMLISYRKEDSHSSDLSARTMLPLAVATGIDALAVGISLSMLRCTSIITASVIIGSVTFCMCAAGIKIGSAIGIKKRIPAELLGGIALILMGIKELCSFVLTLTMQHATADIISSIARALRR